jgi:hypothetical protein
MTPSCTTVTFFASAMNSSHEAHPPVEAPAASAIAVFTSVAPYSTLDSCGNP